MLSKEIESMVKLQKINNLNDLFKEINICSICDSEEDEEYLKQHGAEAIMLDLDLLKH